MVTIRAKEHIRRLDKGIHHSPKHMVQALAHRALHGSWPHHVVVEVLCSMEGESWEHAFVRRVIRAEQREIDALGDMRSNASATAGRPNAESCAKGGRISGTYGGENDKRFVDATIALQAAERAHKSVQEAACGAPQDAGLQAAAAAAAAAVAVARDAHGKAQQQKARTSKGKQTGGNKGGNNHRVAKGPNTQKCGGCGELGGQWRSCPRNPESAKRSQLSMHRTPVHDDGPGEPGKRWGKRTTHVYAERLMVASAATAVAAQPQPRGMKRPPPHPQPHKQTYKIANFNGSRLQLAKPLP